MEIQSLVSMSDVTLLRVVQSCVQSQKESESFYHIDHSLAAIKCDGLGVSKTSQEVNTPRKLESTPRKQNLNTAQHPSTRPFGLINFNFQGPVRRKGLMRKCGCQIFFKSSATILLLMFYQPKLINMMTPLNTGDLKYVFLLDIQLKIRGGIYQVQHTNRNIKSELKQLAYR